MYFLKKLRENASNLTLEQCYEAFEKFIKVFILLDGKYKHWKKRDWEDKTFKI